MKVIYIAGLARSGTTFLELLLGGHSEIVGIGETAQILKHFEALKAEGSLSDQQCSCGQSINDCAFWSAILKESSGDERITIHDKICERFQRMFPGKVLLDSSKGRNYLKELYLEQSRREIHDQLDLNVVYIMRDYRGWVKSILKHKGKKGHALNYLLESYRWLWANIRARYFLKSLNLKVHFISYEELVFGADDLLKRLCHFLKLEHEPSMIKLDRWTAHSAWGNSMRLDKRKSKAIHYDASWFQDLTPGFLSMMTLPVCLFNSWCYKRM